MNDRRLQSSRKKGDCGPQNMVDHISKMPDDVLVMILSRLIVEDAVVTGSLSTRWKHLWRKMSQLNFDGTETLDKMADDEILCDLERRKFIKQVNHVINSHNNPTVKEFLITFDLDDTYSEDIDKWIQFAIEKKVEKLELRLMDQDRDEDENYDFRFPSSSAMVVKMLSLNEVFLNGVNLNEPTLNIMLKNSPHLVKLKIISSYQTQKILHWYTPMKVKRKVKRVVAPEGHKHLQLLEIIGYCGRISDLELAVYVIDNAVGLKKIVIDPCCHASGEDFPIQDFSKREKAARSAARRQLTLKLPSGVNLATL
ncbi:F-box/FBD/LRR-repeat protein At4g00160-like [Bidens hawaiensis]|uniref:F-box/FBD/LRR-repeat protein At4g00160-like n=1 Tax=Bidens hawaiensis TaxID=980011 RepID=UPI0040495C18